METGRERRMEVRAAGLLMVAIGVGVTLSGCAHTHDLTTATPATEVRTALQGLEGKDVVLALRNGVQAYGEVKALDPDLLELSVGGLPKEVGVPYLDIQRITVYNHGNAAATGAGIVIGAIAAFKVAEYVANNNVPIPWLYEIPAPLVVPATLGLGAVVGGTIASLLFPASDTYIFHSSQPDTVLLLVDRLLEDGDKTIRVRIRSKSYALPTKECEVVRQPDGVYVKAARTVLKKAGIPLR